MIKLGENSAGDLEENSLSNLMSNPRLLQLHGMQPVAEAPIAVHRCSEITQQVCGVTVWRPLLEFAKSAVFDLAHEFGVPYLKVTHARV